MAGIFRVADEEEYGSLS